MCIIRLMNNPNSTHSEPLLFVVRIWFETQSDGKTWRGSAEQVATGQRFYFASLRDLNDFISFRIEAGKGETDGKPAG